MNKINWFDIGDRIIINDKEDMKRVQFCIKNQIDMFIDEYNRIWNEGGQYIADCEFNNDFEQL